MAQTTTLKLPPRLKRQIAPLARSAGKTPHAWMVEALAREAERARLRADFLRDADEAAREIDAGGPLYAMEDVHAWILARAEGKPAKKPRPIKRRR